MAAVIDHFDDLAQCPAEPFAALHARFLQPLRRFFAGYRLNAADVEDLTQEVFMRLADPGLLGALRTPEAFVFTLARNLVRDRARRLHTRAAATAVSVDEIELTCGRPTPEQRLQHDERLRDAVLALDRLKPTTRQAFVRHRVDGASYAQIAEDMCISVSMVEKHVSAAIAALRVVDSESHPLRSLREASRPRRPRHAQEVAS